MRKIVLCAFVCLLLSGCEAPANAPEMISCGGYDNPHFSYFVDKNTGVVYLWAQNGNQAGLSVMLNADGSVVTADQLEITLE